VSTQAPAEPPVEETLAWEAQWRPRASAAAFIAAITSMGGSFLAAAANRTEFDEEDGFRSVAETLGATAANSNVTEPSLYVRQAQELGDRVAELTLGSFLTFIGALATLGALTYLFRATRARNPQIGRAVGWSIAVALALYPLGNLIGDLATWVRLSDITDNAEATPADVREITTNGLVITGRLAGTLGTFALALAVVLTALNAMRVGLLTRFMGILGMITGALILFPVLAAPSLLVRSVWLALLGVLFARRASVPPAWDTGRAEPWPTQQELRERRDAVSAEHREDPGTPEDTAAEPEGRLLQPGEEGYVPGAARRKRKKRR
jgi:hypothetical protein